jgi:hypothetical protein
MLIENEGDRSIEQTGHSKRRIFLDYFDKEDAMKSNNLSWMSYGELSRNQINLPTSTTNNQEA